MRKDDATEITLEDVEKMMLSRDNISSPPICNWCQDCYETREVGPNFICRDCEEKERAAGRPLVFTTPVKSAYFMIAIEP